jgi:hypothetical protein
MYVCMKYRAHILYTACNFKPALVLLLHAGQRIALHHQKNRGG